MFCSNCGKFNPDGTKECKYCGCKTKFDRFYFQKMKNLDEEVNEGVETGEKLGLWLGFIGLFIGRAIFPYASIARSSFMYGWKRTVWINILIVVAVVVTIILFKTGKI